MAVHDYKTLAEHSGHEIQCVLYGAPPVNAALECIDCGMVLLDFENEDSSVVKEPVCCACNVPTDNAICGDCNCRWCKDCDHFCFSEKSSTHVPKG